MNCLFARRKSRPNPRGKTLAPAAASQDDLRAAALVRNPSKPAAPQGPPEPCGPAAAISRCGSKHLGPGLAAPLHCIKAAFWRRAAAKRLAGAAGGRAPATPHACERIGRARSRRGHARVRGVCRVATSVGTQTKFWMRCRRVTRVENVTLPGRASRSDTTHTTRNTPIEKFLRERLSTRLPARRHAPRSAAA